MMDRTSTQRGLSRVVRRLGGLTRGRSFPQFKGAIEPSFTTWIRNHWQFTTVGWFRPVAKNFHRPKNLLDGLVWPRPQKGRLTNYTFSPTLKLTCFRQSSSKTAFEINGARFFQTLTMQLKDASESKAAYLRTLERERLSGNVRTNVSNRSSRSLVFIDKPTPIEIPVATHLRTDNTRLRELFSLLFSTVFRHVEGLTRSFMTVLHHLPNATDHWNVKNEGSVRTMRSTSLVVPGDIARQRDSIHWFTPTALAQRLGHMFLTLTKRSESAGHGGFVARLFPIVALDFNTPNVAEAELINRRIAHFVSSPSLTYAKREHGLSEGIVNVLRGLRASQVEQKPAPVPQLPSVEQLTSQVRTQLERELRIERERRGL